MFQKSNGYERRLAYLKIVPIVKFRDLKAGEGGGEGGIAGSATDAEYPGAFFLCFPES